MHNKTNILNPLKIGLLSFFFILSSATYAENYYVDAVNGNDSNGGISEVQAWRTVAKVESASYNFSAGDVIAFKRGQTFKGSLFYRGPSGTEGNPITFTSYGTGDRAIITGFDVISGTWVNEGSNKWSLSTSTKITRLHKDGVELKRTSEPSTGQHWNEFGQIAGCVWIWDNYKLYYYSETDPSSSVFEGAKKSQILTLSGKSYINIVDLNLMGGTSSVIALSDCSYININNCNIGKNSSYGIVVSSSSNLIIERNTFDSNFKLTFVGIASYSNTDARGVDDALVSWGGITNSEIRYNDFINWPHSAVSFVMTSSIASGNKVHHNYVTAPDLLYARAFSFGGDGSSNNELYNNYVYKTSMRSQLNGINNHIHHNWFDDVKDSPYKFGEQGQGIALENFNGNPTGNIYEYNTISNTENACMELLASGTSTRDISGNTFRKNLFDNCGTNAYYSNKSYKGIVIGGYVDIRGNNFYENVLTSPQTSDTIFHRDAAITPSEFNTRDGMNDDDISGNTSTVTDQGAGVLDVTTIGVNAGSTSSEPIVKTGAFIMTKDGLH